MCEVKEQKTQNQSANTTTEGQIPAEILQDVAAAPIQTEETALLQEANALAQDHAELQEAPPQEAPPQGDPPQETPPQETPPQDTPPQETPPQEAPPQEERSETLDEVRHEALNIVNRTGDVNGAQTGNETESAEDRYFDELPVEWKEASDDASVTPDIRELKARIGALREGNLYQAVIVSRRLKSGKDNPVASGAISRAVHSSAWTTVGDINAIATGATGLISTFDKNKTSQNVYQGISLVTNLITIISSARAMYLKWEKMKFRNKVAWTENFFLGVGMIGDLALMFAKAVAIAKTISSWAGKDLPILKKVSDWMFLATGTSQAIALMNTSRALTKTCQGIRAMSRKEEELWIPVKGVIREVLGERAVAQTEGGRTGENAAAQAEGGRTGENSAAQTEGGRTGENAAAQAEGEGAGENAAAQAEGEGAGENAAPPAEADTWNKGMRIKKAEAALAALHNRNDEAAEQKKDILVQYLGVSKRISKQKHEGVELASTAVNSVVGLFSSIVTGGKFVTSYGTDHAKADKKGGWDTANKVMKHTGTAAGLAANSSAILSSSVKIGSRIMKGEDKRSEAVKERLLGKLETLERDEYGLKYLEDSITRLYAEGGGNTENNPEKDAVKAGAEKVEGLYRNTQGMFQAMGVPLEKLVKGKSQEDFEKILISSLI